MITRIDPAAIEIIEDLLNRLDFVLWDRVTGTNEKFDIYGWIEREKDSYKDFVIIEFTITETDEHINVQWIYSSSSAKYSEKIGELLEIEGHNTCQRAEAFFKNANTIKGLKE